ncbi:DUF937 domain-containing protein [Rhodobium gokarnense]|uniref:DUF937 domain-containing protein n=1 Tax=Rhodobium gokarnense TaxID=364296 RepID=A0ABT3HCH9_9HYPH|nr:DUF937 domain-containing protein [Rhodobium gokarnense]MCW2308098.1 hypothetical protein [Rhodobium gokarnense]
MSYSLINLFYDAQNGDAMENIARQYGLSMDNAERVVEAMLPAFSLGLKRNTANPLALAGFLQALRTGGHQRYFLDPMAAFAPTRRHEEDVILGHLLGSKEISRAVSDQVEQATGIATNVVRAMLPAVAAILMGGLAHEAPRQAMAMPLDDFLEGFARGRPEPPPPEPDFNVLDALGDFLEGFGRGRTAPSEEDVADEEVDDTPPATGEEMFGSLFDAGLDIQRAHMRAIRAIFAAADEAGDEEEEED